jgi:DNA-binding transcriptional ArsR family regulator
MSESSDLVWKALSDSTRREVLDLLRAKPRTTGELCEHFKTVSRFSVMKHLQVLHDANLILIKREGRVRWNYLNVVPLRRIYERWVKAYEGVWAERAINLKDHLERKR